MCYEKCEVDGLKEANTLIAELEGELKHHKGVLIACDRELKAERETRVPTSLLAKMIGGLGSSPHKPAWEIANQAEDILAARRELSGE